VLNAEDRAQWEPIADAIEAGAGARHGGGVRLGAAASASRRLHLVDSKERAVDAFDDVRFPVALGRDASVEPAFSRRS
jgi:hypothetical protein